MGNYIDITYFQNYVRQTFDGTTTPTDAFVQSIIDESETEIEQETGKFWGKKTYTDEVHDNPKAEVLLNHFPVISVTEVKDQDGNVLGEGYDKDYIVDGNFIVLQRNITTFSSLHTGLKEIPGRILVTYDAGYDPVNIHVKRLTTLLTIHKLKQQDSFSQDNTESITVGPISITSKLSVNTVLNLEKDIDRLWFKIRRLVA